MPVTSIRDRLGHAEQASIPWDAPDMSVLSAGRSAAPAMPQALFAPVWPLVADLADGAGAPADYVAMGLVAVVAALVGGRRKIRPWDTSDWAEPCVLWVAAVGDPSAGKSPALSAISSPLRDLEVDLVEQHKPARRAYQMLAERAKAERKAWEDAVKKAVKDGQETPEMPEAADDPDEIHSPRIMLRDATPEAIAAVLAGNPAGVLSMRDELSGWLEGLNRYAEGGRAQMLESFGGGRFTVDRKGAAKPLIIEYNGVCVLGGIQPEKLATCLLDAPDDGMVSRFLWAWPDPIPFAKPKRRADTEELDRIYRRLSGLGFGRRADGKAVPVVLPLTGPAAAVYERWCQDHLAAVGEAASLSKGFAGKLKGVVLRLALVGELLRWAASTGAIEPREVSAECMAAAIELAEDYLKPMASRVFGDAALPPVERNAATLARLILDRRMSQFNARSLHRGAGCPANLKDKDDRRAAIEHLVEADWLRALRTKAGDVPGGRTRDDYVVNPGVHGASRG